MSGKGQIPPTELACLAEEVVRQLGTGGVVGRLFGSLGVAVAVGWNSFGGNRVPKDIDIVLDAAAVTAAAKLLSQSGWIVSRRTLMLGDRKLVRLTSEVGQVPLDIYTNPLCFNQKIELRGRLNIHLYALSIADLLLTKLQILHPSGGDLADILTLTQRLYSVEGESSRVLKCCCSSWGFWYTAKSNIILALQDLDGDSRQASNVGARRLLSDLDSVRKTFKWQLRSIVGSRLRWYHYVDV